MDARRAPSRRAGRLLPVTFALSALLSACDARYWVCDEPEASKQAALARLRLDPSQPGAMPPPIAAYLSDEERAAIMAAF